MSNTQYMDTSYQIEDAGSLHRYRTELPNTVVRGLKSHNLSVYAKWLYVYLKSVAGDAGECHQSTSTLAKGSGISRGQICAAKKELLGANLISLAKGAHPNRDTDTIRMRDIWLENMQEFVCVRNTNGKQPTHEPHPLEAHRPIQDEAPGVHNTNTDISSVHAVNSSIHNTNPGVHVANQRRSLEEDLLKKKERSPSVVSPVAALPIPDMTQPLDVGEGGVRNQSFTATTTPPYLNDSTAMLFDRSLQEQGQQALAHLNTLTGRIYPRPNLMLDRLKDGATVADLTLVMDWWQGSWALERPNQATLLGPTTPFRPERFDEYLALARQWDEEGRPEPQRPHTYSTTEWAPGCDPKKDWRKEEFGHAVRGI